jgi:F0F1-type ATP synthase membrane subunit b/b'
MKGVINMSTMLEHTEVQTKVSPRKFRENRHPAMKNTVTVPMTIANESHSVPTRVRHTTPNAVDMARSSADSDANAALMKLRELVVGPTQQLNEARLEELLKIFDEREAELRAVMRDIQKRNSELEVALKQSSLDQLNAFKAEFQALTDAMSSESKKVFSTIRDEISAARKEAMSLVQDAKAVADQKLEAQHVRTLSLVDSETGKLRLDLESATDKLETSVILSQREAQFNISRVLKEASENLARVANAS